MNRPYLIGLTGSIGMGKSTTSKMFCDLGAAVWDADDAVHRMYSAGGRAVAAIEMICPSAVIDGAVSRERLKSLIRESPSLLNDIENIVHPLVRLDRTEFIGEMTSDIVVCDIPLLFETGGDADMDCIVVVSASAEIQRNRVLARDGMTKDLFSSILARQMPDADKRARADYVIATTSMDAARAQVSQIVTEIRAKYA